MREHDLRRLTGGEIGIEDSDEVVEVMTSWGSTWPTASRSRSTGDAEWADVVVTMGCGDKCPYVPGARYLDWDLPDPKGQPRSRQ